MTTPTDDEVRALVERLQKPWNGEAGCRERRDIERARAATMLSRLLAERAEARKAEPVAYQYRHTDPISGNEVWLASSYWNGHRATESRPLYLHPPTDPQKVRALLMESLDIFEGLAKDVDACAHLSDDEWYGQLSICTRIRSALVTSPTDTTGGE